MERRSGCCRPFVERIDDGKATYPCAEKTRETLSMKVLSSERGDSEADGRQTKARPWKRDEVRHGVTSIIDGGWLLLKVQSV
jgi:hypothetical protein